jgi:hypothetical protein
MKRSSLVALAVLLLTACPQPVSPSMPWLRGVTHVASSDQLSADVLDPMDGAGCDDCTDVGAIELVADVAAAPGSETIIASYRSGVVVLDAKGVLLAHARGFSPEGSADELLSLVVADAPTGTRVIAIAIRAGGRRENHVRMEIYRVQGRALEVLFRGVVEEHDDESNDAGSVTFTRDGIRYVAPRASGPEVLPAPATNKSAPNASS